MAFFIFPPLLMHFQVPLLYLNNILALAVRPEHQLLRVAISLPVLLMLVSQSLHRTWDHAWGRHYAMDCLVLSTSCVYIDWILLCNPDKEAWRKIRYEGAASKQNGEVESIEAANNVPQGFWERAWWGVRLATGPRYVGWSCQVKNVPVEVPASYPRVYVSCVPGISKASPNSVLGSSSLGNAFAPYSSTSLGISCTRTLRLLRMGPGWTSDTSSLLSALLSTPSGTAFGMCGCILRLLM